MLRQRTGMADRSDYAHLHTHTGYSSLDGLSRLDDLCGRAAELGQSALAVTDHGNEGGAWKFVKAAKKAGVKPIVGQEFYLAIPDGYLGDRAPEPDGRSARFHENAVEVND